MNELNQSEQQEESEKKSDNPDKESLDNKIVFEIKKRELLRKLKGESRQ